MLKKTLVKLLMYMPGVQNQVGKGRFSPLLKKLGGAKPYTA